MNPFETTGTRADDGAQRSALHGAWHTPVAAYRHLDRRRRELERALGKRAPTRALVALPRTARFMGTTATRKLRADVPGLPVPSLSPALAAQVAMDEAILAMAMGPNRFPRRADYERVAAELAEEAALLAENGWLHDPASYHRTPPPLPDPAITKGWALGERYERIVFPSGWLPRDEEPGSDRWATYRPNATASAVILRHPGAPRPWVVGLHGFATGFAFMDLIGLHARHLHRDLGLNVALPVLPLHGPRKITRVSGENFLSFDLINTLHGLTQAVWDVRRVLDWVRRQEPRGVALYGVSLGGFLSALLAGLEPGLDAVIAGIPVVDFPELFRQQSPHHIRLRAVEHNILDGNAELVHSVVSPLHVTPTMPRERRFIFAGLGDRMAPPTQAHALWAHWDEPEMQWYGGNHVGYLWSRQVTAFLGNSLRAAGLVADDSADSAA